MWNKYRESEIEQEPGGYLDIAVLALVVLIIVCTTFNVGAWLS